MRQIVETFHSTNGMVGDLTGLYHLRDIDLFYIGDRLKVYTPNIEDDFYQSFYLSRGPIYIIILDDTEIFWFHLYSRVFKMIDGQWIDLNKLVDRCREFYAAFEEVADENYIPPLVRVHTEEFCLSVIEHVPSQFKNLRFQNEKICLAAVKRNGFLLKYVRHQTPEICLAAVREAGPAIQFVDKITEELALEAVRQSLDSIQFIENPSEKLQLEVIRKNKYMLKYINNPTQTVLDEVLKADLDNTVYNQRGVVLSTNLSIIIILVVVIGSFILSV